MFMRKPIAQEAIHTLILILVFILLLAACGDVQAPEQTQQFVGSINSDKYHYPDCRWAQKIKPGNEVWFSSSEEARKAGYKPCKVCGPPVP